MKCVAFAGLAYTVYGVKWKTGTLSDAVIGCSVTMLFYEEGHVFTVAHMDDNVIDRVLMVKVLFSEVQFTFLPVCSGSIFFRSRGTGYSPLLSVTSNEITRVITLRRALQMDLVDVWWVCRV